MRSVYFLCSMVVCASAGTLLMDSSGGLRLKIPDLSTRQGVITVISSPGTPSFLPSSDDVLSLEFENPVCLTCRGATLKGTSITDRSALATVSLVSGAILIDGITEGDVEAVLKNTRHARTLSALFRARVAVGTTFIQTLIFCFKGGVGPSSESALKKEVRDLFDATAAEVGGSLSFDDFYKIRMVSVETKASAAEVLAMAQQMAGETAKDSVLATALQEANDRIREFGNNSVALDPPYIAQAFVTVASSYARQSRAARSKIISWRSRTARGLWVEGFGSDAESLRKRVLESFDSETLAAAGLPGVASYRLEMRNQLQLLVESTIRELFAVQVENLEKSILKKCRAQLLKKLDVSPDDAPSENAIIIKSVFFSFENIMDDLEVPSLSLSKAQAGRDMEAKLTNEVLAFADSPGAQIKRTKKIAKATNKEKKPGQRSVDFGLDVVAMLRPDGYGSLQGFAGYNVGGSSVTFGVHNDADDPQTIAQFGGVRPPLLRIQPKLRLDIEV